MKVFAIGLACLLTIMLSVSIAQTDNPPADAEKVAPDFEQLIVTIEPFRLDSAGFTEELRFDKTGVCWYKALPAGPNPVPRGGGFQHTPKNSRMRLINRLLQDAKWLASPGVDEVATSIHPTTVKISLKRDGKETSITWRGDPPEPYAALLQELGGIAAQERRIYLKNYLAGREGNEAWQEIGRELAALRGEPYSKSNYDIDYERYLPTAQQIIRSFHGKPDDELIPAIRLIAYLKAKSELPWLHRLADDRSSRIRQEIAMALGKIHEPESLPVLVKMMMAAGTSKDVGFELIQWGPDAVPEIVSLIEQSTDGRLEERERVPCEDMIRTYLDHWSKVPTPIDPDVVTAVRKALDAKDPLNGTVRVTYHKEFLRRISRD